MSELLVDSHCHLDFPEFAGHIPELLERMAENRVGWALCAGVTLERHGAILDIARSHANIFASVGVHPDIQEGEDPDVDRLVALADDEKVVAIGETGLDYYRLEGDLEWQRKRFRTHIEAARRSHKPLIIHTRAAAADTLRIMREEKAEEVGGVFHCFTEDDATARQALDMGFLVSFSGIVTFKNAAALREIARLVPLDHLLVETDAPYLAPVPFRGKLNEPSYVRHVATEIASVKSLSYEQVATATTDNFFRLFSSATR